MGYLYNYLESRKESKVDLFLELKKYLFCGNWFRATSQNLSKRIIMIINYYKKINKKIHCIGYYTFKGQNHRPGQLAAHIALGITWGGLVGDRGHRKGQLRVLGSPSARHTKEPRTGGPPGGRGVRGPDFFLRKSLRTYLRILKPDCRPPGSIGNILATLEVQKPKSETTSEISEIYAPLCRKPQGKWPVDDRCTTPDTSGLVSRPSPRKLYALCDIRPLQDAKEEGRRKGHENAIP